MQELASDRLVGGSVLAIAVVVLVLVTAFMWIPPFSEYAIFLTELVVWLAVAALAVLAAWIGWTILETVPPPPLEEKQAQVEKPTTQGSAEGQATGSSPQEGGDQGKKDQGTGQ
ncbi:MAG: hypothetical protein ACP5UI_03845 [Thermoprotei archaeon]|nr:hypothetical protein [TACK group archaeon]